MSEEEIAGLKSNVTRRDFLRGAAYAGLAATVGIPL